MKNNSNESFNDERLSNDPEENLRLENEILRLKINAEFGGISGSSGSLPPALENEFLKNVLAFEQSYANAKSIKLRDLLGNPVCKQVIELNDEAVTSALQHLESLMQEKGIAVDFIRTRDARFKYRFITEELFEHETEDTNVPGMIKHFTYEEFHPDHAMEIEERAKEFLEGWFERSINMDSLYLGPHFIQPDGNILSKEKLVAKLNSVFDAYTTFENWRYIISEINFDLHKDGEHEGLGYAEGAVQYEAVLETGERKKMDGPFKIYCSRKYGWWSIMFIYLTGFNS
jgi:hypothetical protein